jgi:hypothetical protein
MASEYSRTAGTAMASEYATPYGVLLRQTRTHHFRGIPLLTSGCAFDGVSVPAVIRVAIGALCAVQALKYPRKGHSSLMVEIRRQAFPARHHITLWLCL